MTKEQGINPKDLIGATKPDLSLVPQSAIVEMSRAMADGARKYGPYNWREKGKPVQTMTYLSAAQRHLASFIDGENDARDSGCHHLGHAMSCMAILIDAMAVGNAVDNRPLPGKTSDLIEKYTATKDKVPEVPPAPATIETILEATQVLEQHGGPVILSGRIIVNSTDCKVTIKDMWVCIGKTLHKVKDAVFSIGHYTDTAIVLKPRYSTLEYKSAKAIRDAGEETLFWIDTSDMGRARFIGIAQLTEYVNVNVE